MGIDALAAKELKGELIESRTVLRRLDRSARLLQDKVDEAIRENHSPGEVERLGRELLEKRAKIASQESHIKDLDAKALASW